MKAKEIKVGGRYTAKVSGKLTTVRVDAIREITRMSGTNYDGSRKYRDAVVYDVTNLTTGRRTTFRSATKFRGDVKDGPQKRNYVPSKLGDKQFAEDKARTVADVNRDQGRETEEALGPIRDGGFPEDGGTGGGPTWLPELPESLRECDESDNPSNGWRNPEMERALPVSDQVFAKAIFNLREAVTLLRSVGPWEVIVPLTRGTTVSRACIFLSDGGKIKSGEIADLIEHIANLINE